MRWGTQGPRQATARAMQGPSSSQKARLLSQEAASCSGATASSIAGTRSACSEGMADSGITCRSSRFGYGMTGAQVVSEGKGMSTSSTTTAPAAASDMPTDSMNERSDCVNLFGRLATSCRPGKRVSSTATDMVREPALNRSTTSRGSCATTLLTSRTPTSIASSTSRRAVDDSVCTTIAAVTREVAMRTAMMPQQAGMCTLGLAQVRTVPTVDLPDATTHERPRPAAPPARGRGVHGRRQAKSRTTAR
mmetsp:Transcript_11500/g.36549  ORF Transcript_11500/g.36549 Transcript_11500/m.36549 type:complete len:249 (+) Transcript_11500:176-922(+)